MTSQEKDNFNKNDELREDEELYLDEGLDKIKELDESKESNKTNKENNGGSIKIHDKALDSSLFMPPSVLKSSSYPRFLELAQTKETPINVWKKLESEGHHLDYTCVVRAVKYVRTIGVPPSQVEKEYSKPPAYMPVCVLESAFYPRLLELIKVEKYAKDIYKILSKEGCTIKYPSIKAAFKYIKFSGHPPEASSVVKEHLQKVNQLKTALQESGINFGDIIDRRKSLLSFYVDRRKFILNSIESDTNLELVTNRFKKLESSLRRLEELVSVLNDIGIKPNNFAETNPVNLVDTATKNADTTEETPEPPPTPLTHDSFSNQDNIEDIEGFVKDIKEQVADLRVCVESNFPTEKDKYFVDKERLVLQYTQAIEEVYKYVETWTSKYDVYHFLELIAKKIAKASIESFGFLLKEYKDTEHLLKEFQLKINQILDEFKTIGNNPRY